MLFTHHIPESMNTLKGFTPFQISKNSQQPYSQHSV